MRIQDREVVSAPCVTTMEAKDVNGASIPATDIKFSPTSNDTSNSNGILSPPTTPSTTTPSENDYAPSTPGSGRFKFFKDGKIIFELWHHKTGERMLWIPVSKNSTYWPPTGHCTPRQESSTSLSVSDDNSSIQSSPWQRDHDHCWKKTVPRKNINREREFSMRFVRRRKIRFSSLAIRRKRRRPYDPVKFEINEIMKEDATSTKDNSSRKLSYESRKKINEIIQKLLERRSYENATSSCRTDPGIVSPRKRILKEMEKVSLEEMGNVNKKHRARTIASNASGNTVSVITGSVSNPAAISSTSTATVASKSANNHSITSILSRDEEPSFLRNLLKSPNDTSSESKSSFTAESPSGADIRIPQSRPSHCSTPITSSLSPPYSKSLQCPQPIPSFIQPTYLYHTTQPFLASPPISNHPPYYSPFPSNYRDPSLWSLPSSSSLPRQSVYPTANIPTYPSINPSPWVPVAHSSFQGYSVTENGNDAPLNLSKH